jgi:glutamate racemase
VPHFRRSIIGSASLCAKKTTLSNFRNIHVTNFKLVLFFIQKNINSLLSKDKNIDTIILGCTHYPLLINKIKKYLPPNITLLSQGEIVAESLIDYLKRHLEMEQKCTKGGSVEFYTTDSPENFDRAAFNFFGSTVESKPLRC